MAKRGPSASYAYGITIETGDYKQVITRFENDLKKLDERVELTKATLASMMSGLSKGQKLDFGHAETQIQGLAASMEELVKWREQLAGGAKMSDMFDGLDRVTKQLSDITQSMSEFENNFEEIFKVINDIPQGVSKNFIDIRKVLQQQAGDIQKIIGELNNPTANTDTKKLKKELTSLVKDFQKEWQNAANTGIRLDQVVNNKVFAASIKSIISDTSKMGSEFKATQEIIQSVGMEMARLYNQKHPTGMMKELFPDLDVTSKKIKKSGSDINLFLKGVISSVNRLNSTKVDLGEQTTEIEKFYKKIQSREIDADLKVKLSGMDDESIAQEFHDLEDQYESALISIGERLNKQFDNLTPDIVSLLNPKELKEFGKILSNILGMTEQYKSNLISSFSYGADDMGAEAVATEMFGEYEDALKELVKGIQDDLQEVQSSIKDTSKELKNIFKKAGLKDVELDVIVGMPSEADLNGYVEQLNKFIDSLLGQAKTIELPLKISTPNITPNKEATKNAADKIRNELNAVFKEASDNPQAKQSDIIDNATTNIMNSMIDDSENLNNYLEFIKSQFQKIRQTINEQKKNIERNLQLDFKWKEQDASASFANLYNDLNTFFADNPIQVMVDEELLEQQIQNVFKNNGASISYAGGVTPIDTAQLAAAILGMSASTATSQAGNVVPAVEQIAVPPEVKIQSNPEYVLDFDKFIERYSDDVRDGIENVYKSLQSSLISLAKYATNEKGGENRRQVLSLFQTANLDLSELNNSKNKSQIIKQWVQEYLLKADSDNRAHGSDFVDKLMSSKAKKVGKVQSFSGELSRLFTVLGIKNQNGQAEIDNNSSIEILQDIGNRARIGKSRGNMLRKLKSLDTGEVTITTQDIDREIETLTLVNNYRQQILKNPKWMPVVDKLLGYYTELRNIINGDTTFESEDQKLDRLKEIKSIISSSRTGDSRDLIKTISGIVTPSHTNKYGATVEGKSIPFSGKDGTYTQIIRALNVLEKTQQQGNEITVTLTSTPNTEGLGGTTTVEAANGDNIVVRSPTVREKMMMRGTEAPSEVGQYTPSKDILREEIKFSKFDPPSSFKYGDEVDDDFWKERKKNRRALLQQSEEQLRIQTEETSLAKSELDSAKRSLKRQERKKEQIESAYQTQIDLSEISKLTQRASNYDFRDNLLHILQKTDPVSDPLFEYLIRNKSVIESGKQSDSIIRVLKDFNSPIIDFKQIQQLVAVLDEYNKVAMYVKGAIGKQIPDNEFKDLIKFGSPQIPSKAVTEHQELYQFTGAAAIARMSSKTRTNEYNNLIKKKNKNKLDAQQLGKLEMLEAVQGIDDRRQVEQILMDKTKEMMRRDMQARAPLRESLLDIVDTGEIVAQETVKPIQDISSQIINQFVTEYDRAVNSILELSQQRNSATNRDKIKTAFKYIEGLKSQFTEFVSMMQTVDPKFLVYQGPTDLDEVANNPLSVERRGLIEYQNRLGQLDAQILSRESRISSKFTSDAAVDPKMLSIKQLAAKWVQARNNLSLKQDQRTRIDATLENTRNELSGFSDGTSKARTSSKYKRLMAQINELKIQEEQLNQEINVAYEEYDYIDDLLVKELDRSVDELEAIIEDKSSSSETIQNARRALDELKSIENSIFRGENWEYYSETQAERDTQLQQQFQDAERELQELNDARAQLVANIPKPGDASKLYSQGLERAGLLIDNSALSQDELIERVVGHAREQTKYGQAQTRAIEAEQSYESSKLEQERLGAQVQRNQQAVDAIKHEKELNGLLIEERNLAIEILQLTQETDEVSQDEIDAKISQLDSVQSKIADKKKLLKDNFNIDIENRDRIAESESQREYAKTQALIYQGQREIVNNQLSTLDRRIEDLEFDINSIRQRGTNGKPGSREYRKIKDQIRQDYLSSDKFKNERDSIRDKTVGVRKTYADGTTAYVDGPLQEAQLEVIRSFKERLLAQIRETNKTTMDKYGAGDIEREAYKQAEAKFDRRPLQDFIGKSGQQILDDYRQLLLESTQNATKFKKAKLKVNPNDVLNVQERYFNQIGLFGEYNDEFKSATEQVWEDFDEAISQHVRDYLSTIVSKDGIISYTSYNDDTAGKLISKTVNELILDGLKKQLRNLKAQRQDSQLLYDDIDASFKEALQYGGLSRSDLKNLDVTDELERLQKDKDKVEVDMQSNQEELDSITKIVDNLEAQKQIELEIESLHKHGDKNKDIEERLAQLEQLKSEEQEYRKLLATSYENASNDDLIKAKDTLQDKQKEYIKQINAIDKEIEPYALLSQIRSENYSSNSLSLEEREQEILEKIKIKQEKIVDITQKQRRLQEEINHLQEQNADEKVIAQKQDELELAKRQEKRMRESLEYSNTSLGRLRKRMSRQAEQESDTEDSSKSISPNSSDDGGISIDSSAIIEVLNQILEVLNSWNEYITKIQNLESTNRTSRPNNSRTVDSPNRGQQNTDRASNKPKKNKSRTRLNHDQSQKIKDDFEAQNHRQPTRKEYEQLRKSLLEDINQQASKQSKPKSKKGRAKSEEFAELQRWVKTEAKYQKTDNIDDTIKDAKAIADELKKFEGDRNTKEYVAKQVKLGNIFSALRNQVKYSDQYKDKQLSQDEWTKYLNDNKLSQAYAMSISSGRISGATSQIIDHLLENAVNIIKKQQPTDTSLVAEEAVQKKTKGKKKSSKLNDTPLTSSATTESTSPTAVEGGSIVVSDIVGESMVVSNIVTEGTLSTSGLATEQTLKSVLGVLQGWGTSGVKVTSTKGIATNSTLPSEGDTSQQPTKKKSTKKKLTQLQQAALNPDDTTAMQKATMKRLQKLWQWDNINGDAMESMVGKGDFTAYKSGITELRNMVESMFKPGEDGVIPLLSKDQLRLIDEAINKVGKLKGTIDNKLRRQQLKADGMLITGRGQITNDMTIKERQAIMEQYAQKLTAQNRSEYKFNKYDAIKNEISFDMIGGDGKVQKVIAGWSDELGVAYIKARNLSGEFDRITEQLYTTDRNVGAAIDSGFFDRQSDEIKEYMRAWDSYEWHVKQVAKSSQKNLQENLDELHTSQARVATLGQDLMDKQREAYGFNSVMQVTNNQGNMEALMSSYLQKGVNIAELPEVTKYYNALDAIKQKEEELRSAGALWAKESQVELQMLANNAKQAESELINVQQRMYGYNSADAVLGRQGQTEAIMNSYMSQGIDIVQLPETQKYYDALDALNAKRKELMADGKLWAEEEQNTLFILARTAEEAESNMLNVSKNAYGYNSIQKSTQRKGNIDSMLQDYRDQGIDVDNIPEVQAYYNALEQARRAEDECRESGTLWSNESQVQLKQMANNIDAAEAKLIQMNNQQSQMQGTIITGDKAQLFDGVDKNDIDSVRQAMQSYVDSLDGASVKDFDAKTKTMTYTMSNGKHEVKEVTLQMQQFGNSCVETVREIRPVKTAFEQFLASVGSKMKEVARYILSFGSFYRIFDIVRRGIQDIREIDTALTELKKVTDATDAQYSQFLKTMSQTAAIVGSTTSELTKSAADWARLGYSMQEAGQLAKNTAILMNVSEFEDVNSATEAMISSLQAFNYKAEDSIQIVDKLNIVGNNFAISSDGIAEGLKRSASTLVAAGNSLEQSIAMLAAGNKVVQDPEALGNALKVLSMRIRGVKTELEEAGEDTDGMVTNTAKLQEKVKALTAVNGKEGVDILNDDGSFRSTYDILLDISRIWDEINQANPKNQAALLELLAGKTRGSQLAGILQNPEDLDAAYQMALNSAGSAARENERYLDSIQGRIDLFNNAVQTMWMNLISSDVVKGVVNLGTTLVEQFDTWYGKIIAILGALDLVFTKYSPKLVKNLFSSLDSKFKFKDAAKDIKQAFMSAFAIVEDGMPEITLPQIDVEAFKQSIQDSGISDALQEEIVGKIFSTNSEGEINFSNDIQSIDDLREKLKELKVEEQDTDNIIKMAQSQMAQSFLEANAAAVGQVSTLEMTTAAKLEDVVATELEGDEAQKAAVMGALFTEENGALTLSIEASTVAKLQDTLAQQGLNAEQIQAIITGAGLAGVNTGLAFSFEALGKGIKKAAIAFLSSPFAALAAIAAGIAFVTFTLAQLITTHGEWEEKLNDSRDSLRETQDTIKDLNKELDTTKDRIKELESKDSLTFVEQEELNKLKEQNDELQRKLELQEKIEQRKQREMGTTFVEATNSNQAYSAGYKDSSGVMGGTANTQSIDYQKDNYALAKSTYDRLLDEYNKAVGTKGEEKAKERLDDAEQALNAAEEALENTYQGLIDESADIEWQEGDNLTSTQKAINDALVKNKLAMLEIEAALGDADSKAVILDEIFGELGKHTKYADQIEKFKNMTVESKKEAQELADEMERLYGQNTDIDLADRPMIEASKMKDAGWTDVDGEYSTVYTSSYSNEDETKTVVVTPILPDGRVLRPDELERYANELLSGKEIDVDIELNMFEGKNSIEQADKYAEGLHNIQEKFYDIKKAIQETIKECGPFIKFLKGLGILTDDVANYLLGIGEAAEESVPDVGNYDNIIKGLNSIKSAYSTLKDAITEYNSNGYLSLDSLMALLELEPQYLALLQMENGQLCLNQSAMQAMVDAKLAEAEATAIDSAISELDAIAKGEEAAATAGVGAAAGSAVGGLNSFTGALSANAKAAIEGANAADRWMAAWGAARQTNAAEADKVAQRLSTTLDMFASERNKLSSNFNSIMTGGGSSGGGSGGSGSSSSEIDWIDHYYTKIENAIDEWNAKLENKVSNVEAIKSKNTIIDRIIDLYGQKSQKLTNVIATYDARAKYLFDSFSSDIKNKINNGSLDITTIKDSKLSDDIASYYKYIEAASDARVQLEELSRTIEGLAKQKFDNISTAYGNELGLVQSYVDRLESQIDLLETRGEQVGASYYESMIDSTNGRIDSLKEERNALQASLDSAVKLNQVKVGSDTWYDMVNAIFDLDAEIVDTQKSVEDFQNSINDLKWDNFDKLITKLQNINSELEHLFDRFTDDDGAFDDKGNWSNKGIAALGMLMQQMENAQYQAKQYGEAIEDLKKDYADGKYSQSEFEEKLYELTEGQWEQIEAYESAKDAIVDLNESRIDAVEDGMKKEIDAYNKLIDKKKEELSAEKDLYDFQKRVNEQQKSIAEIEKQLAAMAGDNSAAANAKRKKLEAELMDAKEDLEETYYDRSMDMQQDALDKESDSFQKQKDDEVEALREWVKDREDVIAKSFELVKTNTDVVLSEIQDISKQYGIDISKEVKAPWEAGSAAIEDYKNIFIDGGLVGENGAISAFTTELSKISKQFADNALAAEQSAKKQIASINQVRDATIAANNSIQASNKATVGSMANVASSGSSGGSSGGGYNYIPTTKSPSMQATSKLGGDRRLAVGSQTPSIVYNNNTYIQYTGTDGQKYYLNTKDGTWDKHAGSSQGGYMQFKKGTKLYKYQYAKGTTGVSKNQIANIDELGEELVVNVKNGRLQYLSKGTGVVPADLTKNLMDWGELDPTEVLNRSRPTISAPHITNNNITLDMNFGTMVNIEHADSDSLGDIQKAVKTQLDRYMSQVNNSLKRYTR